MSFSASDIAQCVAHGLEPDAMAQQLEVLRGPLPYAVLERPCTPGDGLEQIQREAEAQYLQAWRHSANAQRVSCFVPASGAATRMFQSLVVAREQGVQTLSELQARVQAGEAALAPASIALTGLQELAVWDSLLAATPELLFSVQDGRVDEVLSVMLDGLKLSTRPKGLVPFHRTQHGIRTPVEEHLEETRLLCGEQGARVHFTVGCGVQGAFEAVVEEYCRRSGATVGVDYSSQRPATDTIALDAQGAPFRTGDGQLLLRPGGHGSLLQNLQDTAGDLVCIKNIDSVVPERLREPVMRWRRCLVGMTAALQAEVFGWLEALESGEAGALDTAVGGVSERFGVQLKQPNTQSVQQALRRPIRVCGMVANDGEPGGGPFWVRNARGVSRQIVEGAQLHREDGEQMKRWNASTHFNPVDMVCALRDRHGVPFSLSEFVDEQAWLVTTKSYDGRSLTALENPGLWNGAMAHWNTVFVQVPRSTFNPVKTLADLLGPTHRTVR